MTAFLLSSCGGGGNGGGGSNTQPPPSNNPTPSVTSISPSTTTAGATATTVTVNGSGFIQTSTVQWNQSARPTTFVNATQLQAAVTAADLASAGTAQVTVVNPTPGGGTSAAQTFTINNPSPQVTSISPTSVTTVDGGSTLTVNGSGFVATSVITWNGSNRSTTFVSSTQLQTALLASDVASIGSAQISVSNPAPGGGAAGNVPITIVYPVPAITSLNPPAVVAGSAAFVLSVNGKGFGPSSVVQFNGASRTTTYVNSTQLRIAVSATDIANPGSAQITVVTGTPGGGTSAAATLTISTYPVPAITSVYPTSITVNSPDTSISIQGSGFISFSTVQVNGSNITVNGWNSNFISATIPAADLTSVGTLTITVTNPGPSVSNSTTINVTPNPVPTLSYLQPSSAAAGSAAFTLTISGSNFVPTSVVQWNGVNRATTYVNNFTLTTAVSAADIQSLGNDVVTVSNPAPGGGTSNSLAFTTYLPLPTNDLLYNSADGLLYASIPSSAGPSLGNSIVSIDPNTGTLGTPIFVGSEPGRMALSSDGSALWVALTGAGAVRQVNLTTQTAGTQFTLGGGNGGFYNPPLQAQLLAVQPGSPNTIAVDASNGIVTIYDNGVPRTNTSSTHNLNLFSYSNGGMIFDSTGTKLYAAGSGYGILTLDSTGITSATMLNSNVSSTDLRIDSGRAYLTDGVILDANTGQQLGVFSVAPNQNASGPVAPDSAIGRAFVLTNPNYGQNYQVNAYDLSSFVLDGSVPVSTSSTVYPNTPTSLLRWGQDGLAFRNGVQVYIFHSTLVRDLSTSLADLSVTVGAPGTGTTGSDITYNLTISNSGPTDATPATLIDTIPEGSVFKSVTANAGSCTGGAVVRCDLGKLTSGSAATVQIVATALTAGTLNNSVTVAAPEGDPNATNNVATSATVVTGNAYNPAPSLASISPAFVQAGSASFTLTVNGSGFASSSTVELNGTALPTTFVSSSQLTATVDASNVASLGWGWVSVNSPAPGGGSSSSTPLSVYQVLSLDVNRMAFDPFTRKLYASIPSTAPQVTGNSLVAIDPSAASLGIPLGVGSEPDRLAESADGQYLYIGLDGSKSVTRVDLTTMTQGPIYPVNITSFGSPSQIAPRDLAVAPGNDNLLAIDTGAFSGIGLFDISGSTMTQRQNLTSPYTGSSLTFADSSTLYSYDSDTSGAQFNIWTVTGTGLTLNNNTGYTLNGMGGFLGAYKVSNGIVYGFAGGVADPRIVPPRELGSFNLNSGQPNQTIQSGGVAPEPAAGRVFFVGSNFGNSNPTLLSFDANTYEMLSSQQLSGNGQPMDLLRWGRDGLAWHSSLSSPFGGTQGKGQVVLIRGPFVVPQWGTQNPTPGVTATSPNSANHGSGNLTLTVTGSNFVPGAVVLWNGNERTTTFVDTSHVSVAIPASDLAQAGTATVVVNNPGSSNSGSVSFTIQ